MTKIKLNNVLIKTRKVFKRFDSTDVKIQYYWSTGKDLIEWNNTNRYQFFWSKADVRIDSFEFTNNFETYRLYINDELVEGDLLEVNVEELEDRTVVHCKLIIGWD